MNTQTREFEVLDLPGADGVVLSAERHGRAGDEVVILLHGGGQSRSAWRSAAGRIAEAGYCAVSIDLRGHGESSWAPDGNYGFDRHIADMASAITTLGAPATLVGASLGGHVSLMTAAAHPELVRALCLADVTPYLDENIADVLRNRMRGTTGGFDTLDQAARMVGNLDPSRASNQPSEKLRGHLRQGEDGRFYWRWDPRMLEDRFVRHGGEGGLFDQAAQRVRVPVLLMRAELSSLITPEQVERTRQVIPDLTTLEVPGIGHMLTGDSNRAYTGPVLDFLAELRARQGQTRSHAGRV